MKRIKIWWNSLSEAEQYHTAQDIQFKACLFMIGVLIVLVIGIFIKSLIE